MKNIRWTAPAVIRTETRKQRGYTYVYRLTAAEHISLSVSMTDRHGHSTQKTLSDVFSDPDKAVRFFEFSVRNLVTPENLPYVLEDCVDI